jgi:hypothetical protein
MRTKRSVAKLLQNYRGKAKKNALARPHQWERARASDRELQLTLQNLPS